MKRGVVGLGLGVALWAFGAVMVGTGQTVSGTLDLPDPDYDECGLVEVRTAVKEPTFIEPDPEVTAMQFISYCGQRVEDEDGDVRNEPSFKVTDVDLATAQMIVDGAQDLIEDGDVFIP